MWVHRSIINACLNELWSDFSGLFLHIDRQVDRMPRTGWSQGTLFKHHHKRYHPTSQYIATPIDLHTLTDSPHVLYSWVSRLLGTHFNTFLICPYIVQFCYAQVCLFIGLWFRLWPISDNIIILPWSMVLVLSFCPPGRRYGSCHHLVT